MANMFSIPHRIITGSGALEKSMEYMTGFGRHALIVTDEMMVKLENVKKLTYELDKSGISYSVYAGVNSEPDDVMVKEGTAKYKKDNCDFLIGLGGGSPMDTSKAIALMVSSGEDICCYQHKKIEKDIPPVITIPTTAGTGSEATCVTVIRDSAADVKMMISDIKLMADMAVVDPVFTMTAPQRVTVNTGVDALSHAIESYTSQKAFPMSRLYSLDAIRKIHRNLPVVYKDGSNEEARTAMAEASLEAGIAFSNSSVSIVHGMSRPIGAVFHIPHGLSNAMLLKICLPYIKKGAEKELYELAVSLGIYNGKSIREGAAAFVRDILSMLDKLNIPVLSSLNVDKNKYFKSIPKMVEDALASGSPQNCKNIPSRSEIFTLYTQLWA